MRGDQCLAEAGKHFQRIADRGALGLQQLIPFAFTGTVELSDNAVMRLDGDIRQHGDHSKTHAAKIASRRFSGKSRIPSAE